MAMNLRQTFDDLVRFETELWNGIDATLQRECGVTLGTFNVLLVVNDTADCRVNDLAAALSITVGGGSQAVDRIEARGLLERKPNPANRRSSLLSLTASGRRTLETASAVFDDELQAWFAAPLTSGALDRLSKDLATLRSAAERRAADQQSGSAKDQA
jgi:DNA-binding MarR family transcriptional regulator